MRILFLPDRLNWAYHSIALAVKKYNTDPDIDIRIEHIKANEKKIKKIYKKYDRFLVMGFQTYDRINFLPKDRTFVGVHSAHSWDNKRTTPDKDVDPPKGLIDNLNTFLRVNVVSDRLYKQFKKHGVKKIHYTPNGCDTEIFKPENKKSNKKFTIGYSGSSAHDWRKGVSKFIIPAAKKAGVLTNLAMLSTGTHIPLENMPNFYQGLDVYICASSSEGFSLSVLEAASSGLPVISTKVGGCVDLIRDGVDGFLVDRNVDAIADKISLLKNDVSIHKKMSESIRNRVISDFCWSKQAKAWVDFLKG